MVDHIILQLIFLLLLFDFVFEECTENNRRFEAINNPGHFLRSTYEPVIDLMDHSSMQLPDWNKSWDMKLDPVFT